MSDVGQIADADDDSKNILEFVLKDFDTRLFEVFVRQGTFFLIIIYPLSSYNRCVDSTK